MTTSCLQGNYSKKPEQQRPINDEELTTVRSDAGKLAWLATVTSPAASFQANIPIQGGKQYKKTVETLGSTRSVLDKIRKNDLCKIEFCEQDFDSIHIRLYTDGFFQTLPTKHCQRGFIVALSETFHDFSIIHLDNSRAPRRPCSSEEIEVLALEIGIRSLRNLKQIIFQVFQNEVSTVCYVANRTMSDNLTNTIVSSLHEVYFRCRESIEDAALNSACLLSGIPKPTEAMRERNDNGVLQRWLGTDKCFTPPPRVYMLDLSQYCVSSYIPASSVPIGHE